MHDITIYSSFTPQAFVQAALICVVSVSLAVLYKCYIVPYRHLKKLGLNVPMPKPVIGNILDYGMHQHKAQIEWQEKYGTVYGILFFDVPIIQVGDLEILQTVLIKDFSNFINRFPVIRHASPLDKTVIELRDHDWKRVRSILMSTFSAAKLKSIVPLIINASNELVHNLLKAEEQGLAVDLRYISGNFTLKVILGTAFGIEVQSKEQEDKLTKAVNVIFRLKASQLFLLKFFNSLYKYFGRLLNDPLFSSLKYITDITKNEIRERRKNLEQGIPCRNDILQRMIEAGGSDKLDDEEIISQSFLFLVAGYETTANTLAYVAYLLATNPDVQKKLIDEIDLKCTNVNCVDYDTIFELPYLQMVISETLRMYPPVFAVNRAVNETVTVKGIHISKEVVVGIPIYGIHYNSKIWPNPEQFNPERFTPEEKAKHHPCSYLPFGAGPRNCMGIRLALLEAKIALVMMLQNVEFVVVKETEIPLDVITAASLSPANGVHLGVKRRH